MKRTKNENDNRPGVQRFKKLGGGVLQIPINGKMRVIFPDQEFKAMLEEIPPAHRDTVKFVSGEPVPKDDPAVKPEDVVKTEYFPKHKGGGKYVVVDGNGKQVNEGLLSKEEATDLIKSLT